MLPMLKPTNNITKARMPIDLNIPLSTDSTTNIEGNKIYINGNIAPINEIKIERKNNLKRLV